MGAFLLYPANSEIHVKMVKNLFSDKSFSTTSEFTLGSHKL